MPPILQAGAGQTNGPQAGGAGFWVHQYDVLTPLDFRSSANRACGGCLSSTLCCCVSSHLFMLLAATKCSCLRNGVCCPSVIFIDVRPCALFNHFTGRISNWLWYMLLPSEKGVSSAMSQISRSTVMAMMSKRSKIKTLVNTIVTITQKLIAWFWPKYYDVSYYY